MDRTARVAIAWFRLDLRLADNPALLAALEGAATVVPVFVWDPNVESPWAPGAASRWWLHHSLLALDAALRARGSQLVIRRGPIQTALTALAHETGAGVISWSRRHEPAVAASDEQLSRALSGMGIRAVRERGNLLFEPDEIRSAAGTPFTVFGAFWRACMARPAMGPVYATPRAIPGPEVWPESLSVHDLALTTVADDRIAHAGDWRPGEAGARTAWRRFQREPLGGYALARDFPAEPATSRLSPHLHFGEISPRQLWHALHNASAPAPGSGAETFLRELGWREFAYHLLHHFPHTPHEPRRATFARFPWRKDARRLAAWQRGDTGFPIVDAGMRELRQTGWMHNRVRMVTASFLVKHLLIRWQDGAAWFWGTLVDADLANNTLGWQWVAGCGADAAPYFRVFNPVRQGERFDPRGDYVRRWVPELAHAPNSWIHQPWTASPEALASAGVELGRSYPRPVVDHSAARKRALDAFASLRKRG